MGAVLTPPHLIHVGFPKAGSTYLQAWFAAHPQIAYTPGGFAGFVDIWSLTERIAEQEPPFCRVTSAEGLVDFRPAASFGSLDADAMGRIAHAQSRTFDTLVELFPNAHVLIVTRGFRALLRSAISQLMREGSALTVDDLFAQTSALQDLNELYNYDRLVTLCRDRFGDRTIVLPYEMLKDRRGAFLEAICDAVGIAPFDLGDVQFNASLSDVQMHWYPRMARAFGQVPLRPLRSALLEQHHWRAAVGGWNKPVGFLERLFGPAPAIPEIPWAVLEPLRAFATDLRQQPPYAAYAEAYLG